MTGKALSAAILAAAWITLMAGVHPRAWGQAATLPPTAGEWTRADSVGVYVGKDLFLLIDGGADLFFEYGFVRALSSEYSRPPDASAATELYEMSNVSAAYGLFTSFTAGTGTSVSVGQEAVLGEGYCIVWKGPYVAMLTATHVDSASGRTLLDLAGRLERGIRQTGPLPALCRLLRKYGIDSRTMVYVRGKLALGNHLPRAWAAALPAAEGVVGGSGVSRYLILEYADSAAADGALRAAAAEWHRLQLPVSRGAGGKWIIQEQGEGTAMLEQQGRYVLAVSGKGEESETLQSRLRGILVESRPD